MSKKKPNAKSLTMTRKDRLAYEYLSRCAECKSWVESILGIKLTSNDMHEALGNGVILCKLANSVWPGSVKSIKVTEDELFAWKSRENIGFFLDACVRNGSKPEQLFSIEDLYKQANMPVRKQNFFFERLRHKKTVFQFQFEFCHLIFSFFDFCKIFVFVFVFFFLPKVCRCNFRFCDNIFLKKKHLG